MNNDEKKYAELNAKFHKELAEIEKQIERLGERADVLHSLLFDPPVIEEKKVQVTINPDEVPPVEVEEMEDEPNVDELLRYLFENQGAKKSEIREHFKKVLTENQIKRLVENTRRRGLIMSEGRGRAARWYALEEL